MTARTALIATLATLTAPGVALVAYTGAPVLFFSGCLLGAVPAYIVMWGCTLRCRD